MKSRVMCVVVLALMTIGSALAQETSAAGSWEGAIELPNGSLPISVTLEQGEEGAWSGTIDIPAQGLRGFALSSIAADGTSVHFEMEGVPGQPSFDGELDETGSVISGTFTQGQASLEFRLERSEGESDAVSAEPSQPASPVPGEGLEGDWMGALDVGPMELRLVLQVSADGEQGLQAMLDSVDQGSRMKVDSLELKGGALGFSIDGIGASFTGTMNEDGSAIEGTWSQGGRELPLVLHRLAEPFALGRPQNPKPPFPYESREVTFRNEASSFRLAGTLIIPDGEGPFPAVVFVTGSGPQDRDESLMGHKPFLVIADDLARRGIASLRYDDRGVGESEGNHMQSTVGDFATDAEAALRFLASQPEIDGDATGIVGHSEGGLSGPMVAARTDAVDFLILLAPPGEPLDALLMRQGADILRQQGTLEDALIDRVLAMQAEDLALIGDTSISDDDLRELLRAAAEKRRDAFTSAEAAQLGFDPTSIEAGIEQTTTPWFRSLMREDPASYLETITIPVLALFGEKDLQVAADVNAAILETSLRAAGNEDFEVLVLPGLNHLFQHAETGAISEYATIEETFAPEALEMIGAWITARYVD